MWGVLFPSWVQKRQTKSPNKNQKLEPEADNGTKNAKSSERNAAELGAIPCENRFGADRKPRV